MIVKYDNMARVMHYNSADRIICRSIFEKRTSTVSTVVAHTKVGISDIFIVSIALIYVYCITIYVYSLLDGCDLASGCPGWSEDDH